MKKFLMIVAIVMAIVIPTIVIMNPEGVMQQLHEIKELAMNMVGQIPSREEVQAIVAPAVEISTPVADTVEVVVETAPVVEPVVSSAVSTL